MKKFISKIGFSSILLVLISCSSSKEQDIYTGKEFSELNTKLASGWNTWNTRSVLSHVLLPEGIAFDLHIEDGQTGEVLKEALIGRRGEKVENVIIGKRSYDGSYIELSLTWREIALHIKSAAKGDNIYMLVNPVKASNKDSLILNPYMIWDKEGEVTVSNGISSLRTETKRIEIFTSANNVSSSKKGIKVAINSRIAFSTEGNKEVKDIEEILLKAKNKLEQEQSKYKAHSTVYDAVQAGIAWNIIYEPDHARVIMPVSRIWNCLWKGWVLFDWDTYFGAYMLSMDQKEHAYSNAIAMTKSITDRGFIPNFTSKNSVSEDRSQPPVGSFAINQIYKKHLEKWFLHETFDELLSWNRWWAENRDVDGYLCWGSDHYDTSDTPEWLKKHVGKKVAGMWETGLDNSPMYDDVVFDEDIDKLMLADVGLISMYIWDCNNLAEIAGALNKVDIEKELLQRAQKYSIALETLWDDDFGIYLNKDMITGEFSYRLSPTNFYPLLARVPSQDKAQRMINEHFYNPEEFWGTYMIPSIARNDPGYAEQVYWRGRIWGPMNFLVYLGLRNYDLTKAKADLTKKSEELLLQSWETKRHIHENYNAETGQGDDVESSDKFYHWGALLGFISLIENGYVPEPEKSLNNK